MSNFLYQWIYIIVSVYKNRRDKNKIILILTKFNYALSDANMVLNKSDIIGIHLNTIIHIWNMQPIELKGPAENVLFNNLLITWKCPICHVTVYMVCIILKPPPFPAPSHQWR